MDSVDMAWEDLANAIVVKACKDYSRLLSGKKVAGESKMGMRKWFGGRWAGVLCGELDPIAIMRKIEQGTAKPSRGRKVTVHGETHTLAEWSKITGINVTTLGSRLKGGWGEDELLSPPNRGRKRQVKHDDARA